MPVTVTQVVKQFQQDWTHQLALFHTGTGMVLEV